MVTQRASKGRGHGRWHRSCIASLEEKYGNGERSAPCRHEARGSGRETGEEEEERMIVRWSRFPVIQASYTADVHCLLECSHVY